MTATILPFPARPVDGARLAIVGGALRDAIPLASKDAELQLLIQVADKLIDNMRDYVRPDCSDLVFDDLLVRLDQYDAR